MNMVLCTLKNLVVLVLVTALSFNAIALGPAHAAMVPTSDLIGGETTSLADRNRVSDFLQREDVRSEFEKLGVDPDEASARVDALSDAEIAGINQRLDELPAGEGAIGAIVGAAVLIFIVLLITDIACLTNVFNFTRCAGR